jgi:hypothetical protein
LNSVDPATIASAPTTTAPKASLGCFVHQLRIRLTITGHIPLTGVLARGALYGRTAC